MDTFNFVGTLKKISNDSDKLKGFDEKAFESGWRQRQTNFNVICGNDRHLVSIRGGVMTKDNKIAADAKIFSFSKSSKDADGNTVKGEKLEIPFKERLKAEWVEKVAGFRLFVLDTEIYGRRDKLQKIVDNYESGDVDQTLVDELGIKNVADAKAKLEESNGKKKVYISEWDYSKAVNEFLATVGEDDLFLVKGNVDIQYNFTADTFYKSYIVNRIYRAKPESEVTSEVTMDFYFGSEAVDKTDWEEKKTARISGYQRFFCNDKKNNISGEFAAETSFAITNAIDEKKALGIMKKMEKESERPYRKMTVKLHAIDGAQREELKYEDLTDDQKEDIDLGIVTLEDINNALGGAYGESIRDYELIDVVIPRDGNGIIQETDYEDMGKPKPEVTLDDADGLDDIM